MAEVAFAWTRSCLLQVVWGISSGQGVQGQDRPQYSRPLFGVLFPLPSANERPSYPFDYGRICAEHLLILLLGLAYATVAPLLLIFVLFYFVLAFVTWRHQLLYVYQPSRNRAVELAESGGMMWPTMFRCCVAALLIGQITLEGILSLKGGYVQAAVLLPLPFVTVWLACRLESTRTLPAVGVPLEDALAAGVADGGSPLLTHTQATCGADPEALAQSYVTPWLRRGDLRLAKRWRRVLREYLRKHPPTTPLQDSVSAIALTPNLRRRMRGEVRARTTEYGSMSLNLSTRYARASVV